MAKEMTKDSQRIFPENPDRYFADGHFPSSVYAGLKQSTQLNGGCTVLFDGTDSVRGFIVADGSHGFVMPRKEFYSTKSLETVLHDWIEEWMADYFDGFGTWFDKENDRICLDPVNVCVGRWIANKIAAGRGERSFYDALNKRVIETQIHPMKLC